MSEQPGVGERPAVHDPGSDPQVVARRLAGHDPHHGHDTAGLPWAGREISASAFADDAGGIDPRLEEALLARDVPFADPQRVEADIMAALREARLLVPVVAVATDTTADTASGHTGDAESDMATVVLTAPDGERAMAAFTCVDAITRWNSRARPVPVTSTAAAQAALEQGCSVLVLDLADDGRLVVRASQLWALAQERAWVHPAADPVVRAALDAVAAHEPQIRRIELEPGAHGSVRVGLVLAEGLDAARVDELARAVAAALGQDDVRIRLDAVQLTLAADRA